MSAAEVRARFCQLMPPQGGPSDDDGALRYEADRSPPKFFLSQAPITLPAAAEVAEIVDEGEHASVVLRLMWGPLPAPFPRALFAAALIVAIGLLIATPDSIGVAGIALLLAGAPGLALWMQQRGEENLQHRLGALLGDVPFRPQAH